MRIQRWALAAIFLCLGAAARPDDAAVKADIEAQFGAIAQGLPTGDAAPITKAAGKDFQYTDIFGRPGPAAVMAERAKTLLVIAKTPTVTLIDHSCTITGDTALAILRAKIAGTATGRDGKEGPLDMSLVYRTEWAKEGDAWKLKTAKEVMTDGTITKRPILFSLGMNEDEVRKVFIPLYNAVSELYEKNDWETIEKGIDPMFIAHDMDGVLLSKAELLSRIKAGAKILSNAIAQLMPQQLALAGDKVYVVRVMKLFGDVMLPDGKTGRLLYTSIARDTYVKGEKTWIAKSSDELYADALVNNIPIPLSLISGKKP